MPGGENIGNRKTHSMNAPIHAPEIDRTGLTWFNVEQPLSIGALRGKLVILDFWTFCCINCIQIVPTLRRIEQTFPDDVVVIGVHSPKFAAERDGRNLSAAIARYGIVHPVVHDPSFEIWQSYGVRAWPTLVLIDPAGYVIGQVAGEPDPERLIQAVAGAIAEARAGGALNPSPLALAEPPAVAAALAFPAKIKPLVGNAGPARWVVADAGRHQIALFDDQGKEIRRFGQGIAGLDDGPGETARFSSPQGLVAAPKAVYVADTGNHAIRRIDLDSGSVTTLAGNRRRGPALTPLAAPAKDSALASPWDLEIADGALYFANAGSHQLGVIDLARETVRALAGSGGESIVDGAAEQALLAQPSGLALDESGRVLYFVDSETSSVRALDLASGGQVRTLVGTGLFDFGHLNGGFDQARFQHPLGIAYAHGRLYVADSYNAALRVLDLDDRKVSDLDDGFLCQDNLCLPLAEPAGLAVADAGADRLLVADTNNHRILEYRLATRSYRTWVG